MKKSLLIAIMCALTSLVGCTPEDGPDGPGDSEGASFGGNLAKADGVYSLCQMLNVLEVVNESVTTVASLTDAGVRSNAAQNIIEHRNGPDGMPGTGDDDIFDDFNELDDVSFVGPVTLDRLVDIIRDRCDDLDLDSRPYIDAMTFAGSGSAGWTRDADELEATMTIEGITGQQLHSILTDTDSRGRTIFSRLRRNKIMEAFTLSYDIDEMPWDSDSHNAREELKYVPLTIESGRYEQDDDLRDRELSLGTDIMDDWYFDQREYALLNNEVQLRGRVRWDGVDVVRRILIAAKFGAEVGDDGIKRSGKIDVRTEGGRYRDTLVDDVRSGTVSWSGRVTPLEPVRALYEAMEANDALEDLDGRTGVLLVDPLVHLRSTRSRYHMDVPRQSSVTALANNGVTRANDVIAIAEAALMDGTVEAGDVDAVNTLIANLTAYVDGSALEAEVAGGILPASFPTSVPDYDRLESLKASAEAYDRISHALEEEIDDLDREITGTRDLDFEDHVDWFIEWQKSTISSLRAERTYKSFLTNWTTIRDAADRADQIAAYNEFGAAQQADNDDFEDFEALTDEGFAALGKHLTYESVKVARRQIAYAGTVSHMIWFDLAREFYVPRSNRPTGNFLIDTFDMTAMLSHEEWERMSEAERGIDVPLDPAKVYNTALVNEVQIELGQETEFLARIEQLETAIAAGTGTAEDERALAGAQFILDQYIRVMQVIAELKGEGIVDRLEDEGAPGGIEWVSAQNSKGVTALKLLADQL